MAHRHGSGLPGLGQSVEDFTFLGTDETLGAHVARGGVLVDSQGRLSIVLFLAEIVGTGRSIDDRSVVFVSTAGARTQAGVRKVEASHGVRFLLGNLCLKIVEFGFAKCFMAGSVEGLLSIRVDMLDRSRGGGDVVSVTVSEPALTIVEGGTLRT